MKKTIREFVIENYLFGRDDESLQNDDSFLDSGIIDSTGVLELIAFLESQLGVKVENEDMTTDNLDSINKVSEYVNRKLKTVASAPEECQTVMTAARQEEVSNDTKFSADVLQIDPEKETERIVGSIKDCVFNQLRRRGARSWSLWRNRQYSRGISLHSGLGQ